MFDYCNLSTELDISNWNVSNVTNMRYMFKNCDSLTTLDLSNWNVSRVKNMRSIFLGCNSLKTVYCRTQEDLDKFKSSEGCPSSINFIVK